MLKEKNDSNLEFKTYTPLEAYKTFLWVVVGMLLASFLFSFVLVNVADGMKIELEELYQNIIVQIAMTVLSSILFLIIYFMINKKSGIRQFSQIGIKTKFNYKILIICLFISVICLFAISPAINLLEYSYASFGYAPDPNPAYSMDNIGRLIVGIFIMAVLPAIAEELLFRGIILKGLLKKFKPLVAILISAFLFMLMHGSLQQTVYQFILGIIFGYIAYASGSIIYSMLTHFFNNALVLILAYFAPSVLMSSIEYTWLWIIFIVVLAILAICLMLSLIEIIKHDVSKNNNLNTYDNKLERNEKLNGLEQIYLFAGVLIGIIIWLVQTTMG